MYTDLQAAISVVAFETKAHAKRINSWHAEVAERKGRLEEAERFRSYQISYDTFRFAEFEEINHPELRTLRKDGDIEANESADSQSTGQEQGSDSYLTALAQVEWAQSEHLLDVLKEMISAGEFSALPLEETYYLSVNTPKDWFAFLLEGDRDTWQWKTHHCDIVAETPDEPS